MMRPGAILRWNGLAEFRMLTQTGTPSTGTASVTDSPVLSRSCTRYGLACSTNSELSSAT